MQFPSEDTVSELEKSGQLNEALNLYANVIVNSKDRSLVPQFAKHYVDLTRAPMNRLVLEHRVLRKAIYQVVFQERLIRDVPIETYWNVVSLYGLKNQSACLKYISTAPRPVALKLGRLLLYKVEFADKDPHFVSVDHFEQVLLLFLGVPLIREAVVTSQITDTARKLTKTSRGMAGKLSNCLAHNLSALGPESEAVKLCTLFPQLSLPESLYLLRDLANSAAKVSEIMFEEPETIKNMLETKQRPTKLAKTRLIRLDQQEREHRRELLRDFNRQNFKYEYTELENDESDDPLESERSNETVAADNEDEALSKADKKLAALEEQLWAFWQANPLLFDPSARKQNERAVMRTQLNWTNEQIEGWGKMVGQRGRAPELTKLPNEVESYTPKFRFAEPAAPSFSSLHDKKLKTNKASGSSKLPNGKSADNKNSGKKASHRLGRKAKKPGKDANN